MKKNLLLLVFFLLSQSAFSQTSPPLYTWVRNLTGLTGYSGISSNVQTVYSTTADVYVTCTCIPGYSIGPWSGNPNVASNQNFCFKITRNPVQNTGTATAVGNGHIGVWTNGVSIFNVSDAMSYNNAGVWFRNAYYWEGSGFDNCLGHPQQQGEYHHHVSPKCLYDINDSTHHSPIIGYAFDGFPVYGAYAYTNTNGTGAIKRMTPSYAVSTATTRTNGPAVSASYPAGCFIQDYIYTANSGDLDARNGRFCITPEYPSGTYAYFVTINSALAPIFPYTFYGTYYGVVQTGNTLNGGHNTIPGTATQYTTALAPLLAIAASATTICSGTSVTFTPTPTNGGTTPSYQWKKNGVNIATGSSYTTLSLATGDIITCVITSNAYYLTATTATSNSITITVNANVTPSVSINTSTTTICSGTATTFNATPSNGGTTPAYQWKKNGTNIGVNSSAYTDNALANNDAITCVMTSNATCATASTSTSNSVTMTVNTTVTPAVSINTNATTICAGTSVAFNATATNGGTTPTYQWKKNAINVGINSSTYSDNALANNDVISCTMTSNATCKTTSSATSNLLNITTNCPTVTINLKLFIEGYYLGNGMMKAILDPTNYPNTCDSVTVELHNSTTPYSLVYSVNNVISTSGWGSFVFPSSYYNGNYYLAIKCRNGVTIWTKNTYSFSTSLLACDMTH